MIHRPRYFSVGFRLLYLTAGIAVFVAAYLVGAAVPMSEEEAELIRSEFTTRIEGIDETGIFLNNLAAGLAMFVPGIGVGVGVYSGVSTGIVFGAFTMSPDLAGIHPLSVIATPFGILEVIAYGLAMSRSGILAAQIVKRRKNWREYVFPTLIEIGIVVVVLVTGAVVESEVISN